MCRLDRWPVGESSCHGDECNRCRFHVLSALRLSECPGEECYIIVHSVTMRLSRFKPLIRVVRCLHLSRSVRTRQPLRPHSATMRSDVSGCLLTFTDARFSKLSSLPRLVLMGCVNKRSKPRKDCLIQEMTILRNLRCPKFRSPARRSNVSLLITLFDCEDPGAFSSVLFLPLSNNDLELRVCLKDLEGRTIR